MRPVNTIDEIDDEEQFDEYGNNRDNSPNYIKKNSQMTGIGIEESKQTRHGGNRIGSPLSSNQDTSVASNANAVLNPRLMNDNKTKMFESVE